MFLTGTKLKCAWAWWNDGFSDIELEKIKELKNDFNFSDGVVDNNEINEQIRKSEVFFVYKDQQYGWIFEILDNIANSLNSDYFHFDLYELQSIQYTKYKESGDYYDWHWDMHTGIKRNHQRKLSLVLQLNDDYEGGELVLAPCGKHEVVEKKKGLICAFPSFVNHTVTPVTSGERETIVAWYTGPDWR
jgi:PKHD-type hydroxylase